MAENTKNSSCSSATGPVPSKRYPSPSSDSDSKRICLHDSREPTSSTPNKASPNSTKDVAEEISETTHQESLSNVVQPFTQEINQTAPRSTYETAPNEASPGIAQEASQVATEQPALEAKLCKPDKSVQDTAHEACKMPLIERWQEINQETPNAIIEKVTPEVAQNISLLAAENTITEFTSNDTQSISGIPAIESPQKLFHPATEKTTSKFAKSEVQLLSQESIQEAFETPKKDEFQEASELFTKKLIPQIAKEAFEKATEGISPEVSLGNLPINVENLMHQDKQEVLQVLAKGKLKENSRDAFPATIEELTPVAVSSDIQGFSQNTAQEITQARTEDILLEVSQEPLQISIEETLPDTAESKTQGLSQINIKDDSQITTENSIDEDIQKVPQLNTRDIDREVSPEPSQITTEETMPDTAESKTQDLSQANIKDDSQITTESSIDEDIQKVPQLNTRDIDREVSPEPSQITTEETMPDTAESKTQDLSQANIKDDSQITTESSIDEDIQKVPQLNTADIDLEVSNKSSQLLPEDKSKETVQDTSSIDIEKTTSIIVPSDMQGISKETVQENTKIAGEEIKTEISHADSPIVNDSKPSEARRQSRVVEEKKRGQRLFGGLLSTLSQSSPNGQQRRRLEIEKRQLERAKIRKVQDNVNKVERIAKLNAARIKEQSKFKKETANPEKFHIQKANVLAMANFLCTKTEPRLYYKPWELLPEQEEKVKSQIASASAKFKGSESSKDGDDQVRLNDGEKLNESSMEIVGEPHTEPPNIAVVADAHNAATSVIPPTTNDVVDYPNKDSKVEEREREEHNCEVMVENEEDTVIY
ncbi:pinin/SDK/memA domain-containing protein [Blumeria hordei DH14]|uniref:Pinin/SDK/memA domain-containing protein n=1 Tax=Blumeria graminis f. sp. hordei (strain DH14) TaxID=546991 RepID=N1JEH2_BLUG1|nr:pinin/SDK/memA domain-containing protein [Blumeria hordei DH14]